MKAAEWRDETGSAALEAAIVVPAFGILIGLVLLGGRVAVAHQAVQTAAAEAARAASIARTVPAALTDAETAATTSLENQQLDCAGVSTDVDATALTTAVGEQGVVTVSLSCDVVLLDLGLPGVAATRTVSATVSSPVDAWRGRP